MKKILQNCCELILDLWKTLLSQRCLAATRDSDRSSCLLHPASGCIAVTDCCVAIVTVIIFVSKTKWDRSIRGQSRLCCCWLHRPSYLSEWMCGLTTLSLFKNSFRPNWHSFHVLLKGFMFTESESAFIGGVYSLNLHFTANTVTFPCSLHICDLFSAFSGILG